MKVNIKVIPGNKTKFAIKNGEYVLYATQAMMTIGRDSLRDHLTRYIDEFFNPLPKNTFIRVSPYKKDYDYIKNGTHRGSINHATDEAEGGLSVATQPEIPVKYAYYVTGEQIGHGTDGEPLLDTKTVKVASKLMTADEMHTDYTAKLKQKLFELNISEIEYRNLWSKSKLIF